MHTLRTPYELLGSRPDRSQPFVTGYDGPDQCLELSVTSTLNGVAKAVGLLRDELGLAPGERFSIDLPLHWQLPVWTLAGLSAGLACGHRLPGPVAARIAGPDDLAALAAGADPDADEVLGCSCDAFGMPVRGGVPSGVIDVGIAVRAHPDVLQVEPGAAGAAALVDIDPSGAGSGTVRSSWRELVQAGPVDPMGARTWVEGDGPGGKGLAGAALLRRVAVDPLLRDGSVVLARGVDPVQAARLRAVQGAVADTG